MNIEPERKNKDKTVNNHGNRLVEICKSFRLIITNGIGTDKDRDFTCANASTIDYFISSHSLFCEFDDFMVDTFDSFLSDKHNAIILTVRIKQIACKMQIASVSKHNAPTPTLKIKWDSEFASDFTKNIDEESVGVLMHEIKDKTKSDFTQQAIDNIVNRLKNVYFDAAEKSGMIKSHYKSDHKKSTRSLERRSKPWFNDYCYKLRNEYFGMKNLQKKNKASGIAENLEEKKRMYKKAIKNAKSEFYMNLHKELRSLKKKQPRDYWKLINSSCKSTGSLENVEIEAFREHFSNLNQDHKEKNGEVIIESTSSNAVLNRPIDRDEVITQLKRLKNGKAHGEDLLPNEFLKHSTNSLLKFILELFNAVFESGIVPTDWTIGLIRPIYKKKGNPDDPNNYRGITLLSCLGKLFTAVLNHRLNLYLEDFEKIGNEQAGFRNNHSTLDHIFTLHSLLELYLFGRERVYCAFIDYRKAFDIVDRTSLWNKLLLSEINGNFFKVINNIYTQAKSCVIKDGERSSLFVI